MFESFVGSPVHQFVLHLPVLTTLVAAFFCYQLFSRYRAKGGGPHLLWWGIGMATYGVGTLTEAVTTIAGWNPVVFRSWYVAGAFMGGYPLAQGSIYLLTRRRFADRSAWIVSSLIVVASIFVFLTPLDVSQAEAHRLSGQVIEWQWIRGISPFINLYSVFFLVGGALVSALRFRRAPELRHRYLGNILIAVGALLPGIGGAMTRAGFVEALYVTELAGLLLIFAGYRKCVGAPAPAAVRRAARLQQAVALLLALGLVALAAPVAADDSAAADDAAAAPAAATAQAAEGEEDPEDPRASFFATTTVTATGYEVSAFEISTPVTVLEIEDIQRKAPQNAAELLRFQPGVDVNGVGPNQMRPVIRGQRGLRVLYLENGLRMNNPRRQTDFGEIPGLTEIDSVSAAEVVRGPASVLYGSDAIGGVINLITLKPGWAVGDRGLGGAFGVRYGSAGDQLKESADLSGRYERFSFGLGLTHREGDEYKAAAGRFGLIRLAEEAPVRDTGLDDDSLHASFGYELSDRQQLRLRYGRYRADQTGFGFVEPALLGPAEDFRIRILYPFQDFDRITFGYVGTGLEVGAFDTAQVQAYHQSNERQLANDIDINIGPLFPGAPDSSVEADTLNFTDLDTVGTRFELIKVLADKHVLTYGGEFYEDDSFNTDFSETVTTLRFPFPPFVVRSVSTDDIPNAPNAENRSYGVFAQDEILATERFKVTLGARYQNVATRALATRGIDTRGLDFDDDSVVGALNVIYGVTDNLKLVGSWGTAFRAPNIVERLFNGPTPEGAGFQILNPDLTAEESENVDLGLKYLRRNAVFEVIFFRNEIDKGIIQHFLTQAEIAALPQELQDLIRATRVQFVVQQRNIDRLRWEGVELILGYRTANGISLGANYTHLDGKRIDSTNPPTGDTVSDKINFHVRYEPPASRWWAEYRARHNGDQRAALAPGEPPALVGEILPSFTVHTLSGGVTVFERGRQRHRLGLVIDNLTDELYAEFSNASFFRPQPGRNAVVTYRVTF